MWAQINMPWEAQEAVDFVKWPWKLHAAPKVSIKVCSEW